MTSSISHARLTGSGLSSSLPASIFERSSTSLMRLRRWVPAALTRRSGSSAFSVPNRAALLTIISVRPMMALSGVRSSWLMLARNCDLFSLASCSWRLLSSISRNRRAFWIASTVSGLWALEIFRSARESYISLTNGGDHGFGPGDGRNVPQCVIDRGVVPVSIHGATAVLRNDHDVALVGTGASRVLDRHVGPCAGDDDGVSSSALQDVLERGALPGTHAHFLDHVVARLAFEPGHGRGPPGSADHRIAVDQALEQRRVERDPRRTGLDDEPHMNHHDTAAATRIGEAAHVLDRVLLPAMDGRARGGEGAAIHHHVVLQVLDDQGATRGIEVELSGRRRRGPTLRRRRRSMELDPGWGDAGAERPHEGLEARADLGLDRID